MWARGGRMLRGLWWLACTVCALVWGYAVWRLAVRPEDCGPLEASVAAGGWGLSLVPVHVSERRTRRDGGRRRRRRKPVPWSGARRTSGQPVAEEESGWQRGHQ